MKENHTGTFKGKSERYDKNNEEDTGYPVGSDFGHHLLANQCQCLQPDVCRRGLYR